MRSLHSRAVLLAAAALALPAVSQAQGNGQQKQVICHTPPGNPANAHTLTLPEPAIQAHLRHGDTLGACIGKGRARGAQDHPCGAGWCIWPERGIVSAFERR
jgi:hypothetical protein